LFFEDLDSGFPLLRTQVRTLLSTPLKNFKEKELLMKKEVKLRAIFESLRSR
jgi:hypothetical protein